MITKFENPFRDLPPEERKRTTIDIPLKLESDLQRVKSGTILQTTINILLKKLRDELERAGIINYDPEAYELAVADCVIVLGGSGERSAVGGVTAGKKRNRSTKAVKGHDGDGTAGVV